MTPAKLSLPPLAPLPLDTPWILEAVVAMPVSVEAVLMPDVMSAFAAEEARLFVTSPPALPSPLERFSPNSVLAPPATFVPASAVAKTALGTIA
jgi:hypothetical protein